MTPGVAVAAPPQMGEIGFRALTGGIKTYGLTGQTQTQIEGLQMSESAFPDFATADSVDVKTFGNTAVVWFTQILVGPVNGKPTEVRYRYVDVWVNRGGRWLAVASQSTRLNAKE